VENVILLLYIDTIRLLFEIPFLGNLFQYLMGGNSLP